MGTLLIIKQNKYGQCIIWQIWHHAFQYIESQISLKFDEDIAINISITFHSLHYYFSVKEKWKWGWEGVFIIKHTRCSLLLNYKQWGVSNITIWLVDMYDKTLSVVWYNQWFISQLQATINNPHPVTEFISLSTFQMTKLYQIS